jgi:hypothetical protein
MLHPKMISSIDHLRIIVKQMFTDPPPIIDIDFINKITDKTALYAIEKKYDTFIEKNMAVLSSHEVIYPILDIRDAILLRICRIRRVEQMREAFV